MSEEVYKTAGIALDALPRVEVSPIRGRDESITVRTATRSTVLVSMLDSHAAPAEVIE